MTPRTKSVISIIATMSAAAVAIALMAWSKSAHCAELVVIAEADNDSGDNIRYLEGSARALGDIARGTFSLTVGKEVLNRYVYITRKECEAGAGTLLASKPQAPSVLAGQYAWIRDDGTLGDAVADVLCAKFSKRAALKKMSFQF